MANFESYVTSSTRTASSYTIPGGIASQISGLRNSFSAGNTVRATHMRTLRDTIETLRVHTHSYTDFDNVDAFGDSGQNRSQVKNTKVSSTPAMTITDNDLRTGAIISSNHYNQLAVSTNGLRNHTHSYTDFFVEPT